MPDHERTSPAYVLVAAIAGVLAGVGCGSDQSSASSAETGAVATTTQVADLVRAVGGDRVDVEQILPVGADPHDYEPRPSDAAALADAPVVFKSGGDLDAWLDDLTDSAGGDAQEVSLIDSVTTIEGEGDTDPHWWQDPRNAILAVAAIRAALDEADPAGRSMYERNAAAYTKRLERLDAQVARCVERVPANKRKLVTTHDSLGYFARRYGIEVIGSVIPSLSTQAQPSARDIGELVEQIKDEGVEAVFPESSINQRLEAALSREAGVDVGAPLWSDSLGEPGSSGGTYLESIAANTTALVKGMSGGRVRCRPAV